VHEYRPVIAAHLGPAWHATGFTDLGDRASHRCGIFHGSPYSVFAKLNTGGESPAEMRGLELLRSHGALTPEPLGSLPVPGGTLLLLEAVPEIPPAERTPAQWATIGRSLAMLHQTYGAEYGLSFDGYFGPLPQSNQPVPSGTWADFYAARRLLPLLRSARLDPELARGVDRIASRLPSLGGPEPRPTLLHGDAQQNNFLTGASGTYLLDVAPYYGHPEIDLALLDYFAPVPPVVFDAYREVKPIDPDFPSRRELWRLFGYLAVIAVDGNSAFGRSYLPRLAAAVKQYGPGRGDRARFTP
jgi:fructosamine-3-kinase